MRHLLPDIFQSLFLIICFTPFEMLNCDLIFRYGAQYLLCSIRMDDRAHHPMPNDQLIPCLLQLYQINIHGIQFKVTVRRNATQTIHALSPDPISLLYICQWERFIFVLLIR